MAFYVSNYYGGELAGGKRFATLEEGIAAGLSAMRRSIARKRGAQNASAVVALDVVEEIPGRHTTRAIIEPDLTVTRK